MIEILVTGEKLVGKGIRSLGTVIEELIVSATDEIHVAAYLITSTTLVDLLAGAAGRGIRVYVVVNDLGEQPAGVREKLLAAVKKFEHFTVREFSRRNKGVLHAKVLVVDRNKAVVGSANFTYSGMTEGNYEIAVLLEGREAAIIARIVEEL
ncbi:phosphatidylserine/phosphatidylglycerophosphate/cardiolipin synthase family protein [Caldicellulosiruptor acetigenus]|uniref:phospholipase D family protein n=1 Tax=Caldicellulosiruptor acetigenus TaxID=301953 RepID=UPI0022A9AA31|nr:phospholipase D family protein [Caldicellulosiruptor acetigenus]WAM36583.1 phosphatidylserine/phosphatidylglycerophosphate/cardiolipin synthase family protein [Caldicellulosiruptor acetigenus]